VDLAIGYSEQVLCLALTADGSSWIMPAQRHVVRPTASWAGLLSWVEPSLEPGRALTEKMVVIVIVMAISNFADSF
jgi:hypothetical protein